MYWVFLAGHETTITLSWHTPTNSTNNGEEFGEEECGQEEFGQEEFDEEEFHEEKEFGEEEEFRKEVKGVFAAYVKYLNGILVGEDPFFFPRNLLSVD